MNGLFKPQVCLVAIFLVAISIDVAAAEERRLDIVTLQFLNSSIPELMASNRIPGVALALLGATEDTLIRTYGFRKVETRESVTQATVFEPGSIAKTIFAMAVMNLVERGVLDLDTPLAEYAEFESIANDERQTQITARMVLSHTSGLPNGLPPGVAPSITVDPGTRFQYSGWGFRYLQQVIEGLTGKNLNQISNELVFGPIGMNSTSYLWRDKFEMSAANGHGSNGRFSREIRKFDTEYAEGGVVSSIEDLSRYAEFILTEIESGNSLILAMIEPQVEVWDFGSQGKISWSLGWGVEHTSLGNSIWHTGSSGDFSAFIILEPSKQKGLVVLINSANGFSIIPELVSSLMGSHHLVDEHSPGKLTEYNFRQSNESTN